MKNKFVRNTIILTVIGLACVLIPSGLITLKSFFYDLPIGIDAYWWGKINLLSDSSSNTRRNGTRSVSLNFFNERSSGRPPS